MATRPEGGRRDLTGLHRHTIRPSHHRLPLLDNPERGTLVAGTEDHDPFLREICTYQHMHA